MKHFDRDDILAYICAILMILTPLFILGCIILRICVFLVYGNTPITEIPSWAFWIMGIGK